MTSTYSARTRTRTRTCVARTRTSTLVVTRTLHIHQGLRFLHKILRIQTVVCIGRTWIIICSLVSRLQQPSQTNNYLKSISLSFSHSCIWPTFCCIRLTAQLFGGNWLYKNNCGLSQSDKFQLPMRLWCSLHNRSSIALNYYYTPVLHHAALQTTAGRQPLPLCDSAVDYAIVKWVSFAHNSWPRIWLVRSLIRVSPPDVRSEWWWQLAQQASGVPTITKCRLLLCSRQATMTGATAWDLLSILTAKIVIART